MQHHSTSRGFLSVIVLPEGFAFFAWLVRWSTGWTISSIQLRPHLGLRPAEVEVKSLKCQPGFRKRSDQHILQTFHFQTTYESSSEWATQQRHVYEAMSMTQPFSISPLLLMTNDYEKIRIQTFS